MTFISEQGRKALEGVALWLEAGAPHTKIEETGEVIVAFDMSTPGDHEACGTACCIAGAVVAFNPKDFPFFKNVDDRAWREGCGRYVEGKSVFESATEYLGISEEDAEALFEPFDMDDRTPEEGAKVIRHYLATGEVDWPKTQWQIEMEALEALEAD